MSEVGQALAGGEPAIDFETLFEAAPCGYVLADQDGLITRANATFASWVGRKAYDLTGMRFSDLLSIAGKIFYETHFAPTLHIQGRFDEVALEIIGAAGERFPVLVNAVKNPADARGNVQIRMALFRAAERRLYERGLLEARDRAEAEIVSERADSNLREQFIAVLGHDLRNPLASIASGIHMLEKETLSERGKKIVGLMGGSIVRASALIDNVMDFARGRLGGGITLSRDAREPLEPILRQVVSELRSIAPEQIVTADYDIIGPVDCDRVRIGQLLSNLLGNALTHGAKGMPVRIRASTADGELVIAVSNGGEPIPPPVLERLFQPFYRGGDHVRTGLGLGLHIASEIAKAHGGTLTARSDSQATSFIFTMPLLPAAGS